MTTAQPGQEQRMENPFVDKLTEAELDEVEEAMTGRKITRPTADLGEDGELVERNAPIPATHIELALDMTLGVGDWEQSHEEAFAAGVKYARDEARDRLILYMEALRECAHWVEWCINEHDAPDSSLERAALAQARAILSRSGDCP